MSRISRRRFVKTSAAAALSAPLILPNFSRAAQNSDKLNVAVIGAGGRGVENLTGLVNTNAVNIVALCDCDARNAAASFKRFPNAKHHSDWRKMFDQQKDFDAVLVSTPDHNHAVISIAAMKLGKHVYCEKPLARSIFETRRMAEVASETNRVTQMGTQGHAYEGTRRAVEVIRAGVIGDVKELHVWTDRPANWWPQGVGRPQGEHPIPEGLDWETWLGPAPFRPYHPDSVPFKGRGRWDFGTGAI
jgi:predicted dehydrogenase